MTYEKVIYHADQLSSDQIEQLWNIRQKYQIDDID